MADDLSHLDPDDWATAYRVALRVLRSPDLAADAAQDALLKAYAGRDKYEIRNREAWLRRVSYTCALRYLRSPWHRRRAPDGEDVVAQTTVDTAPDEEVSARLLAVCVRGCLAAMRDADRWLFQARYVEGAELAELAQEMGVSTNTAKQRAFRARRRVQKCVRDAGCANPDGAETPLAERSCRPCAGGVPAMTGMEIAPLLAALADGWSAVDDHHLRRRFELHDFAEAVAFARDVGVLAEQEGHHPSLSIEWGTVEIELFTRKCDGLTEADFILAAKIDRLFAAGP